MLNWLPEQFLPIIIFSVAHINLLKSSSTFSFGHGLHLLENLFLVLLEQLIELVGTTHLIFPLLPSLFFLGLVPLSSLFSLLVLHLLHYLFVFLCQTSMLLLLLVH